MQSFQNDMRVVSAFVPQFAVSSGERTGAGGVNELPRRIDVRPGSDGRLMAGQIVDAVMQARRMLAAVNAR